MSENAFSLDETDRKILGILSTNGRINNLALAVCASAFRAAGAPFGRNRHYRELSCRPQP